MLSSAIATTPRALWARPAKAHVVERPAGADDEGSTQQTIDWMRSHVLTDFRSPAVRSAAAAATKGAPTPDQAAAHIFHWIKARVRFRRDSETAALAGIDDPSQAEVLIRPVDLLDMRDPAEDCDGFAMLTAAMLLAAGIGAEWVTIEADPRFPGQYSHIYTRAVFGDGRRLALDTSHGPRPGWEAPPTGKVKTWSVMRTTLGETFWQEIAKQATATGLNIAQARYGQPPPTYQETGPYGTITMRGGTPTTSILPSGNVTGAAGGASLFLIGGLVLVGLVLFSAARKG